MIIAGNFKSNLTRNEVKAYAKNLQEKLDSQSGTLPKIRIYPSFSALLDNTYSHFKIGAQNAYPAINGGFTGEITFLQLQEFGITSLILGHSERRNLLNEDEKLLREKFDFYAKHNFEIIYCIGESKSVRDSGEKEVENFLQKQVKNIESSYENLIIAYEPIWAIGSGNSASEEQIESTHSFLSTLSKAPLLYGGSVSESNAASILALQNVSGVLVGGASLKLDSFSQIIQTGIKQLML